MSTTNNVGHQYYLALAKKDLKTIETLLHDDIEFTSPAGSSTGKDAMIQAVSGFCGFFEKLNIEKAFQEGIHEVVVYDVTLPNPIGTFRAASFMTITDGLLSRVELLYDSQILMKK